MITALILILLAALLIGSGIIIVVNTGDPEPAVLCVVGIIVGLFGFGYRDSALAEQKLLAVSVKGASADCTGYTDNSTQADKYICQLTEPVKQVTVTEFRTRNLKVWILGDKLQIQEVVPDASK